MELNKEQIIKALECCQIRHINKACDDCYYHRWLEPTCRGVLCEDALALIKELTEENDAWQKQLISEKEKADKAYYDLACEVENLRSENERLQKALNTDISIVRVSRGSGKTNHLREVGRIKADAIKADTVRKMQERFNEKVAKLLISPSIQYQASAFIDQIAKEMVEGKE